MTKTSHFAGSAIFVLGMGYLAYHFWGHLNPYVQGFGLFVLKNFLLLLMIILPISVFPDIDGEGAISYVPGFNIASFFIKIFVRHRGVIHSLFPFALLFGGMLAVFSFFPPSYYSFIIFYLVFYIIDITLIGNRTIRTLFFLFWLPFVYFLGGTYLNWVYLLIVAFLSLLGHYIFDFPSNHGIYLVNIGSWKVKIKLPSFLAISTGWYFERLVVIPVLVLSLFWGMGYIAYKDVYQNFNTFRASMTQYDRLNNTTVVNKKVANSIKLDIDKTKKAVASIIK